MFDSNTKILVVDDMKMMRKLVSKSLKEIGFINIVESEDGSQAWQALNEKPRRIQLIISDWNMPVCSGIDFLKRVRANSLFKEIPFVMLTAESEVQQVKIAVELGVDNYVIKPFSTEILKQKLEMVYKKRNAAA